MYKILFIELGEFITPHFITKSEKEGLFCSFTTEELATGVFRTQDLANKYLKICFKPAEFQLFKIIKSVYAFKEYRKYHFEVVNCSE